MWLLLEDYHEELLWGFVGKCTQYMQGITVIHKSTVSETAYVSLLYPQDLQQCLMVSEVTCDWVHNWKKRILELGFEGYIVWEHKTRLENLSKSPAAVCWLERKEVIRDVSCVFGLSGCVDGGSFDELRLVGRELSLVGRWGGMRLFGVRRVKDHALRTSYLKGEVDNDDIIKAMLTEWYGKQEEN